MTALGVAKFGLAVLGRVGQPVPLANTGHRHIMNLAQTHHIPAEGEKPTWKDIPWLAAYGGRGLWELVRARLIFARLKAKAIPERNRQSKASASANHKVKASAVARMTYVLPRISDRLPWRSDCVIQAVAAQNWLMALGGASEIQIGVENPKDGEFGAHAWLLYRGQVVTGGDIDRYHLILSDSRLDRDSGVPSEVSKRN